MFSWIQEHIFEILAGIGAIAVLFGPKIKEQILAMQGEPSSPPAPEKGSQQHNCCCPCCVQDVPEDAPEQRRSDWVVTTMELRQYCEQKRLPEGVDLCDQLVGVIVKGPPPAVKGVKVTREVEVR